MITIHKAEDDYGDYGDRSAVVVDVHDVVVLVADATAAEVDDGGEGDGQRCCC